MTENDDDSDDSKFIDLDKFFSVFNQMIIIDPTTYRDNPIYTHYAEVIKTGFGLLYTHKLGQFLKRSDEDGIPDPAISIVKKLGLYDALKSSIRDSLGKQTPPTEEQVDALMENFQDLITMGLGIQTIVDGHSKRIFLDQSLIMLMVAVENYFKRTLIELITEYEEVAEKFCGEAGSLDKDTIIKIFKHDTTMEEEVIRRISIYDIDDFLIKRLHYDIIEEDKRGYKSLHRLIIYRHVILHRGGYYDIKAEHDAKKRGLTELRIIRGKKCRISVPIIQKLYFDVSATIYSFEKWRQENYPSYQSDEK